MLFQYEFLRIDEVATKCLESKKNMLPPPPRADVVLQYSSLQAVGAPVRTASCSLSGRDLCPEFEIKMGVKGKNQHFCLLISKNEKN